MVPILQRTFSIISLNENHWVLVHISLKFIHSSPMDNKPASCITRLRGVNDTITRCIGWDAHNRFINNYGPKSTKYIIRWCYHSHCLIINMARRIEYGSWWRHDMGTVSVVLALCEENQSFHSERVSNVLLLFLLLLLAQTICRTNNRVADDFKPLDPHVTSQYCTIYTRDSVHDVPVPSHEREGVSMSWWRHQMETFSALLTICAGNSPVTGEFPTQRPVTRSFDVYFDLHPNKRLSKQLWGWWFETQSSPLWRHRNGSGWKQTSKLHLCVANPDKEPPLRNVCPWYNVIVRLDCSTGNHSGMGSANKTRRSIVTPSLIGWACTQNDSCPSVLPMGPNTTTPPSSTCRLKKTDFTNVKNSMNKEISEGNTNGSN